VRFFGRRATVDVWKTWSHEIRITAGPVRQTVQSPYVGQSSTLGYDVTADGQGFLMVVEKRRPPMTVTQIVLVENWFRS
jgi:hypothetical protein